MAGERSNSVVITGQQSDSIYKEFFEVALPLTSLGWQVTGGGGPEDAYSAGSAAWMTAVWNGKKKRMPSTDILRPHLAGDESQLPDGYDVYEDRGRTVLSFEGTSEGLREFGNRALRYAGVQLLETE